MYVWTFFPLILPIFGGQTPKYSVVCFETDCAFGFVWRFRQGEFFIQKYLETFYVEFSPQSSQHNPKSLRNWSQEKVQELHHSQLPESQMRMPQPLSELGQKLLQTLEPGLSLYLCMEWLRVLLSPSMILRNPLKSILHNSLDNPWRNMAINIVFFQSIHLFPCI